MAQMENIFPPNYSAKVSAAMRNVLSLNQSRKIPPAEAELYITSANATAMSMVVLAIVGQS
jgi:hypothetical protein